MFTENTLRFLEDLGDNNQRDWFEANRVRYERDVKKPSEEFATALAHRLGINYGVKTKPKVFRIHRDIRFSKDKTPYNAHIHIAIQDGDSGFSWMFGLEPKRVDLGYGKFQFSETELSKWRESVASPFGEGLEGALEKDAFRLSEPALKRVPSPYPQDHPRGALLRHKGFCVWADDVSVDDALGDAAPSHIAHRFHKFDMVRSWINMNFRATAGTVP